MQKDAHNHTINIKTNITKTSIHKMHAVRGGQETQQMQHSYVSEHIYTHNGKYIHKLNSDCTKCKPSE